MANRVSDKITRVTSKVSSVAGRPGFTENAPQRGLGTKRPFRARRIRTLHKRDEARGISLPEASLTNTQPGQITAKPRVLTSHQRPEVPPRIGTGKRVVTPPSPTSGGGVRNPFRRTSRVGRSGSSKRFGG